METYRKPATTIQPRSIRVMLQLSSSPKRFVSRSWFPWPSLMKSDARVHFQAWQNMSRAFRLHKRRSRGTRIWRRNVLGRKKLEHNSDAPGLNSRGGFPIGFHLLLRYCSMLILREHDEFSRPPWQGRVPSTFKCHGQALRGTYPDILRRQSIPGKSRRMHCGVY